MPTVSQQEYRTLFQLIGGSFSSLKRYEDTANLIGGGGNFIFIEQDEFDFFPDPVGQLSELLNLIRIHSYDGNTDTFVFKITEIVAGSTYSLTMHQTESGPGSGTIASVASGSAYGVFQLLTSINADVPTPHGRLKVEAPTGTPPASTVVRFRVVASAVRTISDIQAETEAARLLKAAAIESHQITASNFRNALLTAVRERVLDDRLFRNLVGREFLGSTEQEIFREVQSVQPDGTVTAVRSGILEELNTAMRSNTPVQTVRQIDVTLDASNFFSDAPTTQGVFTATEQQPTAGTLRVECTRGFTVEVEDPEAFKVEFLSTTLDRKITSEFDLRLFRQFDWPRGGFTLTVERNTTDDDPNTRMTNEKITGATPGRMPQQKLQIETFKDAGAVLNSTFKIIEPSTGSVLFQNIEAPGAEPLPDGSKDITLFNGIRIQFDWANGASPTGIVTFDVTINPYAIGDVFINDYSIANGRLQVETRRQYDFAFKQTSATPTISPTEPIITDLPYIEAVRTG